MAMTLTEWVLFMLARGPRSFSQLEAAASGVLGVGDAAEPGFYRKLDRALQRLRRDGKIVYDRRTGWSLAAR